MNIYRFEKKYTDLPEVIPLFPLNNVLLLPKCKLPLNLFENRYLHMFDSALSTDRIIGMIQPSENLESHKDNPNPKIYKIGCAGFIVAFNQTNDNRYEIVLKGLSRFEIKKEVDLLNGFRRAKVNWKSFKDDLSRVGPTKPTDRIMFEEKLKIYLKKLDVSADWQQIEASSDEDLVNSISMGCPFSNIEKQALLEAKNLEDRLKVLNSLLDMSINDNRGMENRSFS